MLNSISCPSLTATTPPISEGRTSVSSSTTAENRFSSARVTQRLLLSGQWKGGRDRHLAHAVRQAAETVELLADLPEQRRAAPVHDKEEKRHQAFVHLPLKARAARCSSLSPC